MTCIVEYVSLDVAMFRKERDQGMVSVDIA